LSSRCRGARPPAIVAFRAWWTRRTCALIFGAAPWRACIPIREVATRRALASILVASLRPATGQSIGNSPRLQCVLGALSCRALALQQPQRRRGDLYSIETVEQRLQRKNFSRRYSGFQHARELPSQNVLPIPRRFSSFVEGQGLHLSARHATKLLNFARLNQGDYPHGSSFYCGGEVVSVSRYSVKDHRVRLRDRVSVHDLDCALPGVAERLQHRRNVGRR